jgi:hypothetical protein
VTRIVVADTGPLIALGRVECLKLLHDLYQDILIPPAVGEELRLGSGRPGARQSAEALDQGWLQVQKPSAGSVQALSELMLVLDPGEAEAILLAEEVNCKFLLIDERKGRAIANRRGVPVVGIAGRLVKKLICNAISTCYHLLPVSQRLCIWCHTRLRSGG